MKIAVIGGGVYGCTIAVDLARTGEHVELFEARTDLLEGTTWRTPARLHSGYHYPRSEQTAITARDTAAQFAERYQPAIRKGVGHHYVIAPGSKVSATDYLAFCERLDLPYTQVQSEHVHGAELVLQVPEAFIDMDVLRRLLRRDLTQAGVLVHLGVSVTELDGFDLIVWATYGVPWVRPLRYEVCEVAFLELGRYNGESYVVMDGEFSSLDPRGRLYTLYDVVHSVHHVSEGTTPDIPSEYMSLIKRPGRIRSSPLSHLNAMVESASRFLRCLEPHGMGLAIYHGSMWSIRAVLPNVDATDTRPTLVERDGDTIRVLPGKIGGAVAAAKQVSAMALDTVSA